MARGNPNPQVRVEKSRLPRPGCALLFLIALAIWLAGLWFLGRATLNSSASREKSDDSSPFFEIIPGSDERTSIYDDMEDRGRTKPETNEQPQ